MVFHDNDETALEEKQDSVCVSSGGGAEAF